MARRERFTSYLEILQVKHYTPGGTQISQNQVQRYRGALADYQESDAALIITTGSFHPRAEEWAADVASYALVDGTDLVDLIRSEDLAHIVAKYVNLK